MSESIVNEYIKSLIKQLNNYPVRDLLILKSKIANVSSNGGVVYICGNGGSASTASHFFVDIVKGVVNRNHKINVVCLNDNIPIMTAISNDVNFEEVFSYQLENRINQKDLLIMLTGSGNSLNLVRANYIAKRSGAYTASITGFRGGVLGEVVDLNVNFTDSNMQIAEDLHLITIHLVLNLLNIN